MRVRHHSMNNAFVNLLLRWLILALGVLLAERLLPGIRCDNGLTLVVVVLLLSFFNVVLKPLLLLFTLPFIILSMGLGIWLINAVLFYAVGKLVDGFHVAGFGSALLGALIVSVTNLIINRLLTPPPKPPGPPSDRGKRDDVIDV
ncbi:MAG: putative rane protein [Verrucomicrobiota bacterium]|nr:putative rane protein [Verrucomicrobiota bacterium]